MLKPAALEQAVLTEADFPPGVSYTRITKEPGQPDNAGGPGAMLSEPRGCSNSLTDVIAKNAERGPGSAAEYSVTYDGARIVMTALTWQLPLNELAEIASKCEQFKAYFDPSSEGIPITTTKLPSQRPGQLLYQQTLRLNDTDSSVFMSFENVGRMAVFGIAFPTTESGADQSAPKASLPQTFTDIADKQAKRIKSP